MQEHHKVLFPAFLIIFASFLAFNSVFLTDGPKEGVISEVTGFAVSVDGITGFAVSSDCDNDDVIVGWLDENTNHFSMVGSEGEGVGKCVKFVDAGVVDPLRYCESDNSNVVVYVSNGGDDGASFSKFYGVDTYSLSGRFTIVYVADTENNCVRKITPDGVVKTVGPDCGGSTLNGVNDVVVSGDGKKLYIIDSGNYCIKEMDIDSEIVSDYAGICGSQGYAVGQFYDPQSLDIGEGGELYVSDANCVKKVNVDQTMEILAGKCDDDGYKSGDLLNARFDNPKGVVIDDTNNLVYVADKDNHVIRGIDIDNGVVDTLAGVPKTAGYSSGGGSTVQFNEPYGLVLDGGLLYISDMKNQLIRGMDVNTFNVVDYAGNRSAGYADGTSKVMFNYPAGLGLDDRGNIYVADTMNYRVRVMLTDQEVYTLAGNGDVGSSNTEPIANTHVYAADAGAENLPDSYMRVCYDNVVCDVADSGECQSTFGSEWECLMAFEGDAGSKYNAHIGSCGDLLFANDLCCKSGDGAPGYCGDGILDPMTEECEENGDCAPNEVCDVAGGCVCVVSGDSDGDGVDDINDNCVDFPNGADLGTCITEDTHSNPIANLSVGEATTCNSHADCLGETYTVGTDIIKVEYCELSQDNDDGDDCGNACDIDSTDDNMCLEPGDQGLTPPGECAEALVGATFGWEDTSVTRGDLVDVELDLNGDNRCNGVVFFVKVYDADNPLKTSVVDPLPLEVTNDYGKTDWIAENNNPGPDPDDAEWMVKATAGGDVITSNDILIVVAGGISGYCGDGILNTTLGEQCDDGNNDDGDGCSFNCLNETIYGSGYGDGCTSFCVRGTAVCSTDGIMYCGDYDGDGCNEFSNPVSCSPYICDSNFGGCVDDAICTVEIDNALSCGGNPSFVCGKWGDCINGKVIRECKACSGNGCPVSPVKEMNCSIEPPVKGSFFGGIGFLIAVGLLLIYYVRRN